MIRWLPFAVAAILAGTTFAVAPGRDVAKPFPRNGIIDFPTSNRISGRLLLSLTSPAPSGAMLTLDTKTDPLGLPTATRPMQPSRLIVAFTMQVSKPIRAVTFPQWLINVPKEAILDPPYDIEVFVTRSQEAPSREWYAAKVHGLSIVTQPPGCHIVAVNRVQCASEPYVPGSIYIFELVQNPPMSRVPRPWTPGPSRR